MEKEPFSRWDVLSSQMVLLKSNKASVHTYNHQIRGLNGL